MGMDMTEVIMEVEDAFNINIDDLTASDLKTVAGLYAFILNYQSIQKGDVCLSTAVCFRLRRAMMKYLNMPRKNFRIDSSLNELIPEVQRQRAWKAISRETGWRLPELKRSDATVWMLKIGWALILLTLLFLFRTQSISDIAVVGLVTTFLYAVIAVPASTSFAVNFPADCQSVRESVTRIVKANYGKLTEEFRCANPDETWNILKKIIVERLGVSPEKVIPEARFVEDLNCG